MDPDQSNISEAFWRSGSIHQRGFGPGSFGFSAYFQFLDFLAMFTPIFVIWTPCAFYFLLQNSKKIITCSWYARDYFCIVFTCWKVIKIIGVNFSFGLMYFVFFREFSRIFSIQILVMKFWCLVSESMMIYL